MTIKKRVTLFFVLVIVGFNIMFVILKFGIKENKKMIINVEGFDVEYRLTDKKTKIEEFYDVELGSSIYEISKKLGEPDTWIGSGMLRPVYFLDDNKVVVFHFKYPAVCEELEQVVLINENGESQIIKEQ